MVTSVEEFRNLEKTSFQMDVPKILQEMITTSHGVTNIIISDKDGVAIATAGMWREFDEMLAVD